MFTITGFGPDCVLPTFTPTPTPTVTPTPTPTSTPTLTPTPSPTPTSTPIPPTKYLVEPCGGGDGPYIITRGSGDTPVGINQAFKLNGVYAGFNGVTCWTVLEIDPLDPVDYSNVGFGTVFSDCTACVPTPTPTPTPTVTPTPTPTPTGAPTYTINWSNNNLTTGTNDLEILKNDSVIVNQGGLGSGSFTVVSSDVIKYNLSVTSPNFSYGRIYVEEGGSPIDDISNCGFNSTFVNNSTGVSFTANGTIEGIAIDYVDECP